jgi:hypothetical protein
VDNNNLSPLTKWTQAKMYHRFHSSNCNTAGFIHANGWGSGFGSELHVMGTHVAYALEINLILVWGAPSCKSFTPLGGRQILEI